jgi:hypothetical protein
VGQGWVGYFHRTSERQLHELNRSHGGVVWLQVDCVVAVPTMQSETSKRGSRRMIGEC